MQNSYATHDISLVAALLHEGARFITVDRANVRAEFIFDDTLEIRETVRKYWSNELLCPAQSLLLSLKRAKHILHDYNP